MSDEIVNSIRCRCCRGRNGASYQCSDPYCTHLRSWLRGPNHYPAMRELFKLEILCKYLTLHNVYKVNLDDIYLENRSTVEERVWLALPSRLVSL